MSRNTLRAMALLAAVTLGTARARAGFLYVPSSPVTPPAIEVTTSVLRTNTTTGAQSTFGTSTPGSDNGSPLTFDTAGNLYVASQPTSGTPYIEEFTPNEVGTLYAKLLPGTPGTSGLAFNPNGNLYVEVYSTTSMLKLIPGGLGSPFVSFGGVFLGRLAVQAKGAVPESGALKLFGVGLAGVAGRSVRARARRCGTVGR